MEALVDQYRTFGFVHLRGLFNPKDIEFLRSDAKRVFANQMVRLGLLPPGRVPESDFEVAMAAYFGRDQEGFINCGKTCQHMIRLHQLGLDSQVLDTLQELGLEFPNICTRPVLYFNSRHLAKAEIYYKTPPHQDWRSMQGSLNAMVVWIPLVSVSESLGAIQIVPGSHVWGLLESEEDAWFRHIQGTRDEDFVSVEVGAGDAVFFSSFLVHRSGDNITDSIRWSCHFRYNDLAEPTFIERKYPNPYVYRPQQELVTKGFPAIDVLRSHFLKGPSPRSETGVMKSNRVSFR